MWVRRPARPARRPVPGLQEQAQVLLRALHQALVFVHRR